MEYPAIKKQYGRETMPTNDNNLCPLCFSKIPPRQTSCPYCDGHGNNEKYPTALPEGVILVGRYAVGRVLGKGGFGITYLCCDLEKKRRVAIKEYFPTSLAHRNVGETAVYSYEGSVEHFRTGAQKFYDEAVLVAKFNNDRNIIHVYEFFQENNTTYYVMEYLDGMDMKRLQQQNGGKIPEEEVLYIALHMADALQVVHEHHTLHRDLSPDNVFLSESGEVKLIDFGAARQIMAEVSSSLSVIIKHGYAPLEQYQRKGHNQGPWTDIYAFGATLYHVLTGRMPDDAMTRLDDSSLDMSGINGTFAKIIEKMLEVKAEDRYRSVADVKKDLEKLHITPKTPKLPHPDRKYFCEKCGAEIGEGKRLCKSCGSFTTMDETTLRRRNGGRFPARYLKPILGAAGALLLVGGGVFAAVHFTKDPAPVHKHLWQESAVLTQPTCSEEGVEEWRCLCGETEYRPAAKIPHSYEDPVVMLEATADAEGKQIAYCICGAEQAEIIARLGETTYNYNAADGILTFTGSGAIADHERNEAPWSGYADAIRSVVIREGVTAIGDHAFYGFSTLERVEIAESVTEIGEGAFYRCAGLREIVLPDSLRSIGRDAFANCSGLSSLVIPHGVESIADEAFWECTSLASVSVPSSVKVIGARVFQHCTSLTTVELNAKAVLNSNIFSNCPAIRELAVGENYIFEDGLLFDRDRTRLIACIDLTKETIDIPNTVTSIGEFAFYHCSELVSVTLSDRLTHIGELAFGYTGLEKIEIPESVRQIGDSAFASCGNLNDITIKNNKESISIGTDAFPAHVDAIAYID